MSVVIAILVSLVVVWTFASKDFAINITLLWVFFWHIRVGQYRSYKEDNFTEVPYMGSNTTTVISMVCFSRDSDCGYIHNGTPRNIRKYYDV